MPLDIIIGTQWGDEGKGRFVDLLAQQADIVARFNGGDNAGHTVTVGRQIFKLHLIPSGIIHKNTINLMGNGMVIHPGNLLNEMKNLADLGVETTPQRLIISHAAHIITPAHRALDKAREAALGAGLIGTTGRGIGPAYTDKASRQGLRMQDMLDTASFLRKLGSHLDTANHHLQALYHAEPLDRDEILQEYLGYAELLRPYIQDTSRIALDALEKGASILAEGAQGSLLDLDLGTYPYVTSSPCTAASALLGLGIGIRPVRRVIGVTKAFQTRVGSGPFPSEQTGDVAQRLRGSGSNPWDEFGTTTGRPRRVGWLDGVLLRYAVRVNGVTELAITKLDILSDIPELQVCSAYRSGQIESVDLPLSPDALEQSQPAYEMMPGWLGDLNTARHWTDLPQNARQYVEKIQVLGGAPVKWVSVGPEREQVVQIDT